MLKGKKFIDDKMMVKGKKLLKSKKSLVSLVAFLAISGLTFGEYSTSLGVAPDISPDELTNTGLKGIKEVPKEEGNTYTSGETQGKTEDQIQDEYEEFDKLLEEMKQQEEDERKEAERLAKEKEELEQQELAR